jgi:hypothetical protein
MACLRCRWLRHAEWCSAIHKNRIKIKLQKPLTTRLVYANILALAKANQPNKQNDAAPIVLDVLRLA